ncbi:MAG: S8 family serine peptidase [Xanthomonadales bacterium]|nr:S8 family serine peptidase [Xanthomonadales bacterium]
MINTKLVQIIILSILLFSATQANAVQKPQTDNPADKTASSTSSVPNAAGFKAYYLKYQPAKKSALMSQVKGLGANISYQLDRLDVLVINLPEQVASVLMKLSGVVRLSPVPEHKLQAQVVPWNIDQFQARDVWDVDRDGQADPGAANGNGVKFCIIDTGFFAAHDDFQGIVHSGMSQIVGELYTEDGNGHGTHVAGTANAVNNNIGVVGVMPGGAELVIVKIFNNAGLWVDGQSNLLAAVEYCRDEGANVISMSLGGGFDSNERDLFDSIYDNNNMISIAAAGNDGDEPDINDATARSYPASYESVISVAAVRQTDNIADFSQYPATAHDPLNQPANTEWDVVELSGGGENVLSTYPGPNGSVPITQVTNSGTSYSALQIDETSTGDVTQNLVDGNLCDAGDINASWAGEVVLCERGAISFANKMNNVATAGGLAVVLYNNLSGSLNATCGGNCTSGAGIPGVTITQAEGQFLAANGLGLATRVLVDDGTACVGCVGGYNTISGTSMATPGVAAGVAWAWDACGGPTGITNKQLRQLLRDSARDLSGTHDFSGDAYGPGWDVHTGFGLVQLKDALDLGNQRFGSTCPLSFDVLPLTINACTIPTAADAVYNITLDGQFTGTTNMSFSGLPAGTNGAYSPASITFPATTSAFTVSNLNGLAFASSVITLTATDDVDPSNTQSSDITLNTFSALPPAPSLSLPADGAAAVDLQPSFSWAAAAQVISYTFELASDPAFSNILVTESGLVTNTVSLDAPLDQATQYYWRVTAINPCGLQLSSVFLFTTVSQVCAIYTSTDIPKNIADTPPPGAVTSTLNILDSGTITDINVVDLTGEHTFVSDLVFTLTSPAASEITLINRVCGNLNDWDLILDDEAGSATLPCPPTDGLAYQPAGSLSTFDGEQMSGMWTLTVDDSWDLDGGSINTWGLEICFTPPPPPTYTIGGTTSGLTGTGLVLRNNGGDDLAVNADGSFTFATSLNDGSAYSVTVQSQPGSPAQNCSITNASGTLAGANVTDVTVSCITTYTVGGSVSGLAGSGLILQNNAGDDLPVNSNGNFTFVSALNDGSNYAVTVLTDPLNLAQTCTVNNAGGTLSGANISNVEVACVTNSYTIGGTVSGVLGPGLVLQNNGGDDLAVNADGSFTFATALLDSSVYAVTVDSSPPIPDQSCSVSTGSGTLMGANIINVAVSCVTTCRVTTASGMVNSAGVVVEACDNVLTDPSAYVTATGELSLAAGLGITLGAGFTVETGGLMEAKVCGQSLCEVSTEPMVAECHTCVVDICAIEPSCCDTAFTQVCLDMVSNVCGLTCD